jgi:hypothetical protein
MTGDGYETGKKSILESPQSGDQYTSFPIDLPLATTSRQLGEVL